MTEDTTVKPEGTPTPAVAPAAAPVSAPQQNNFGGDNRRGGGNNRGGTGGARRPGGRPDRPRREKPKSEFDQKLLDVRRVARVVAGGRRFSFAVAVVAGDRKGRVGVGTGKAGDTSSAIDKAMRSAKKSMITVQLTKNGSIAHPVSAKYSSARIVIKPALGRGMIAGSAVRNVLDLAGIKDVNAKVLSPSKNKLNIARAALKALATIAKK